MEQEDAEEPGESTSEQADAEERGESTTRYTRQAVQALASGYLTVGSGAEVELMGTRQMQMSRVGSTQEML